ncbi:MAG: 4-(cytidine 5'-diphospho)-2-C-methyl-D-erythritol kinase [Terrimicrobiaceae bacterium]
MAEDVAIMTIEAPAKVNLVLRILGKRPDGFHDLETLMVPITLTDTLAVTVGVGSGVVLSCDDPAVPSDSSNLAHRAAVAFAEYTGRVFRTNIELKKTIPWGAGLGGGSSDAAAVLIALNHLLEAGLDEVELVKIAASIGSDIPFFIRCEPSWCRGRGEVIESASRIPDTDLLLIKPPFPVSTAWAYQAWAAATGSNADVPGHLGVIKLTNDLEAPVFSKHLLLPVLKSWLLRQPGVSAAMMSGSGSTVFAVLNKKAQGLEERVREEFGSTMWTCLCRTLANRPTI